MPFDGRELRRVMATFCTGVTIITTRDDAGRPFGLTANAVTSVSLIPPLLLVCVDRTAESHAHFLTSKVFVVNVLSEEQEALSRRFAVSGGDKFADVGCRPGRLGVPVLDGTLAHLECRIVETHEGGDHVIHIGEVEHAELHSGRPLLFFQGRYGRLP
jgi:3-hydroxy-9,10-secoandrosta-1,3,5(10)-triene-9,17-dione monooxygenase reductase component